MKFSPWSDRTERRTPQRLVPRDPTISAEVLRHAMVSSSGLSTTLFGNENSAASASNSIASLSTARLAGEPAPKSCTSLFPRSSRNVTIGRRCAWRSEGSGDHARMRGRSGDVGVRRCQRPRPTAPATPLTRRAATTSSSRMSSGGGDPPGPRSFDSMPAMRPSCDTSTRGATVPSAKRNASTVNARRWSMRSRKSEGSRADPAATGRV